MPRIDTDSFYRGALARHGNNAEGVHWASTRTQQVRFAALRRFLPRDLSAVTLVDVGCGLGDLFVFLREQDEAPFSYLGIDVVAPMVEAAAARTGRRILHRDVLQDELPGADYYVCSGAMNTLTRDETELFIRRCFAAAERGFVFNLLKGRQREGTFNHFMPDDLLPIATELGVEPDFADDYLPDDFTVSFARANGA
jgi:SAM-dependent methyltransferase